MFRDKIDPEDIFDDVRAKLRAVVARTMDSPVEHAFLFKYPMNRHALSPYEERLFGVRSVSYWRRQLDELYYSIEAESASKIQILDVEEALHGVGFSPKYFRPEPEGGHVERPGAALLVNLFLE